MNYSNFLSAFIFGFFFLKPHLLSELNFTKKSESFDEIERTTLRENTTLYLE